MARIAFRGTRRDKWTCGDCGRRGARFECHHVNLDPADNRLENLIILCRSCHQARHYRPKSKARQEWAEYLKALAG